MPASATMYAPAVREAAPAAPVPPAGSAWLQGVLTDQAGHALDNVNVEVWSTDPTATAPVGSNLTYAGAPADGRHAHGAYRVEVPSDKPYTIVFSGVGGAEDGDAYRMQSYGQGRPLMVRSTTGNTGKTVTAGTTRNLGATALVHQGRVNSTMKAKLGSAKVPVGKKAKLKVSVHSPFVSDVTGKVVVTVNGKKVHDRLGARDNGKSTLKLPKLKKPGKYKVVATFGRTGTVQASKSKPVKLTVTKKKKK
jgi:hypothetical protein